MMKFRKLLVVLTAPLFLTSLYGCTSNVHEEPLDTHLTKPNVILIMTDDQGYGDLSFHGNPILKTPHLDNLAQESVRFTDFHVSPFCTPTRAALMTGNYPAETGAYRTSSGRTMMHKDEKTLANLFEGAGYKTGMVGKWHLGENAPHRPQDRGFQDVLWHKSGGVGQVPDYWGNDYFDDVYDRNGKPEKFEGYVTDIWFEEAQSFIDKNIEDPFFLYLSLNAPHGPYFVPAEWAEPYLDNPEVANANFYGMIANIDHNVGKLREYLKRMDLDENTILIFMTDNGTAEGGKFSSLTGRPDYGYNAGMRGKKSSIYDGGHRVPFFIHWPEGKLSGGNEIDVLAAHIDVLPTLADLTGISVPPEYDVDGLSLTPLLDKSDQKWPRDHLIVQYHGAAWGGDFPLQPFANTAILTEKWRLINEDTTKLFDITVDPGQDNDVSEQFPEVVEKLKALYEPFWPKVSPRMTPVPIEIGSPAEPEATLTSQDWYMETGNPPWNFEIIKELPKVTGPWNINVVQEGEYKLTLRQWPKEANIPIKAKRAALKIAGKTLEKDVSNGSAGVDFKLHLPEGLTQLTTHLYDENDSMGGAYFVDVEFVQ